MRFTEQEILNRFQSARESYRPLVTMNLCLSSSSTESLLPDAFVKFTLDQNTGFEAMIEVVPRATPKNIIQACWQLREYLNYPQYQNKLPLVLAPYISPQQAELLKDKQVSWIDLSGNMLVRVPPSIYLERSGNKNQFPDSAPIKKIFQGTSSLISRALLLRPRGFSSLKDINEYIQERGIIIEPRKLPKPVPSTISRVINILEEELLVRKDKSGIQVIRAEMLLNKLSDGYLKIKQDAFSTKRYFSEVPIEKLITSAFFENNEFVVGGYSAAQLKGLAVTDKLTIYQDIIKFQPIDIAEYSGGKIRLDDEFGQIEVIQCRGNIPLFNARQLPPTGPFIIDDLQLYLEMACSTPRGPEIAEKLKPRILEGFSA